MHLSLGYKRPKLTFNFLIKVQTTAPGIGRSLCKEPYLIHHECKMNISFGWAFPIRRMQAITQIRQQPLRCIHPLSCIHQVWLSVHDEQSSESVFTLTTQSLETSFPSHGPHNLARSSPCQCYRQSGPARWMFFAPCPEHSEATKVQKLNRELIMTLRQQTPV